MFTNEIKGHLKYRLGTLNKYTLAGFFYWDDLQNKFVAREGYTWYFVYTLHFVGYFVCCILAAYTWFLISPDKIPDVVVQESNVHSRHLLTLVCVIDIFMICGLIIIVSSAEVNNLPEVIASYNQGFNLNEIMRKLLIPDRQLPQDPNQLFQDNLIKFVCYFTYAFPILFACNIIQCSKPFHNLVKNFLEIHVDDSFLIVGFVVPFIAYGAVCLVNHATVVPGQSLIDSFLVTYWFYILKPVEIVNTSYEEGLRIHVFQTAQLGQQTEQNLVIF